MTARPLVRRLREREVGQAAGVLTRAFWGSPLTEVLMPDPARREAACRWLFGANLRYGHLYGEVWGSVGPGSRAVTGAAVWWAPAYAEPDEERSEASGLADGLLVVGPSAWDRLVELADRTAELHRRCAPDRHWYLAFLGVEPSLQGHGIGGQLLRPMLDRLDAERLPAYLETAEPRNLAYYPRFGFEVAGEVTLPIGVTVWGMRRAPR